MSFSFGVTTDELIFVPITSSISAVVGFGVSERIPVSSEDFVNRPSDKMSEDATTLLTTSSGIATKKFPLKKVPIYRGQAESNLLPFDPKLYGSVSS